MSKANLGPNNKRDMFANTDHNYSCSCALRLSACHWFNVHSDGKSIIATRSILSCCSKYVNLKRFKMCGWTCRNLLQWVVGVHLGYHATYNRFSLPVWRYSDKHVFGDKPSSAVADAWYRTGQRGCYTPFQNSQCNMLLLNCVVLMAKYQY